MANYSYLIFRTARCHYTFSLSKRLDPIGALNRSTQLKVKYKSGFYKAFSLAS